MNWHVKQIDNIHILTINGRFDAHTAPAIKTWLRQVTVQTRPQILVHLGGTHFIDSAALAVLISGLKRCREQDGELVLTNLAQPVRIIFELTRMDQIFTIMASDSAALAALAHSRSKAISR